MIVNDDTYILEMYYETLEHFYNQENIIRE
jgi:hypothetical protein